MVQTRNLETWDLLPGIEAGDIGPKFGYNSKDNGFMLFKNVRIPRTNMLKRFAEVDKDGNMVEGKFGICNETCDAQQPTEAPRIGKNLAFAIEGSYNESGVGF